LSLNKEILVFLGPPGSGKGSISELCVKHFGWTQLSTGNMCRKHIAEQTQVGKAIDFAIKSGKLISDELVTSMIEQSLQECLESSSVIILDGYPRTVTQARQLAQLLETEFKNVKLKLVRFNVGDDLLIKRLSARYICKNQNCQAVYSVLSGSQQAPKHDLVCDRCSQPLYRREDDQPTAVKERLKMYHAYEQDLLNYYRTEMPEYVIDLTADKALTDVFEDFKTHITAKNV
jgi:adenylate kinase